MAKSAANVIELRTTGNDLNGGGFKSGASGTDRSQQDAAQVVIDNATIICTTTGVNSNIITFVSGYVPSAADIGNLVYVASGTNITAGTYEITAQSSTTWTVTGDQNLTTAGGAGAALVAKMGGALLTVSAVELASVTGNRCYCKSGTYAFAASVTMSRARGSNVNYYEGYGTTRGDMGTKPVWQTTATTVTPLNMGSSTYYFWRNIAFDGNSQTTSHCSAGGNSGPYSFANCTFTGYTASIFNPGGTQLINCWDCSFNGAAGGSISAGTATLAISGCEIFGFTTTPLTMTGSVTHCIFRDCTGSTTDGVAISSQNAAGLIVDSCSFKSIGRYGVSSNNGGTNVNNTTVRNCVFSITVASSYGIRVASGTSEVVVQNCAFYVSGGTGDILGTPLYTSKITLTADPFTDSANNNFLPNNTSGGGASLRAAAAPTTFPAGLTPHYLDIGASQSRQGTQPQGSSTGRLAGMMLATDPSLYSLAQAGVTTYAMSALNTGWACRFMARNTRDVKAVYLNFSSVASPGVVTVRIETVDATTRLPTGTLYDANATKTLVPAAGWNTVTFATPPSTGLTAGTEYAVVVLTTTGGTTQTLRSSMAGSVVSIYPSTVLTAADGTTRSNFSAVTSSMPVCNLLFSDNAEEPLGLAYATATSFAIYGTRAWGGKLVTDGPLCISGVSLPQASNITGTPGDMQARLYDTNGALLASVTANKTSLPNGNNRRWVLIFNGGPYVLPAGTYRIVLCQADTSSTAGNNWTVYRGVGRSVASAPGWTQCETTDYTAGAITWTDNASSQPALDLILNSMPSGGGLLYNAGMNGGMLA